MMAAMLKSVAFPLSPFVGIPSRARDDDTLVRLSVFPDFRRLSPEPPGLPLYRPSLGEKSEKNHLTLTRDKTYQTILLVLSSIVTSGSFFCHQVLHVCIDMICERSTSSSRSRYSPPPLQQSRVFTAIPGYRELARGSLGNL